jgi:hypothetical protein
MNKVVTIDGIDLYEDELINNAYLTINDMIRLKKEALTAVEDKLNGIVDALGQDLEDNLYALRDAAVEVTNKVKEELGRVEEIEKVNKYDRTIQDKYDDFQCTVDVYSVLEAFNVANSALQHLIKKALCVGIRGHKDTKEDLEDIIASAIRAYELEGYKID